jgi:hypothetical protein
MMQQQLTSAHLLYEIHHCYVVASWVLASQHRVGS